MVWQFERKDRSRQKKFRNQHTSDLGTLLEEDYVRPWDTHFLCGQPAVLHYTPPSPPPLSKCKVEDLQHYYLKHKDADIQHNVSLVCFFSSQK